MSTQADRTKVLAVLKCGATQDHASYFGDPAEKAAVRELVREGIAIIVRETVPPTRGNIGPRVAWIVARFAPGRPEISEAQNEDREHAAKQLALREASHAALAARDAIDNPCTPEWRAAHARAREACLTERAYVDTLARDPATRYGSWRTPTDRELQLFGYL